MDSSFCLPVLYICISYYNIKITKIFTLTLLRQNPLSFFRHLFGPNLFIQEREREEERIRNKPLTNYWRGMNDRINLFRYFRNTRKSLFCLFVQQRERMGEKAMCNIAWLCCAYMLSLSTTYVLKQHVKNLSNQHRIYYRSFRLLSLFCFVLTIEKEENIKGTKGYRKMASKLDCNNL